MSQGFKLKFEQMLENNPAKPDAQQDTSPAYDDSYLEASTIRNLCFVLQDGKRVFLNYSYLVCGEYSPIENCITITYTTHKVKIIGVNLESLFYKIMEQKARQIVWTDARYNVVGKDSQPLVNEIQIQKAA